MYKAHLVIISHAMARNDRCGDTEMWGNLTIRETTPMVMVLVRLASSAVLYRASTLYLYLASTCSQVVEASMSACSESSSRVLYE